MACLERLAGLHPGPWILGRSFSIADIVVFDLVRGRAGKRERRRGDLV